MPAYNFKKQFAEAVASGRKTCTIREVRKKRPTRVGDRLFLFTGMRQGCCRLLKDTECVKLTPIDIWTSGCSGLIKLDGKVISHREIILLAIKDGFRSASDFLEFFAETYGPNFSGELIEWRT